jgi:uncharacterized protein
MTPDVNVLVAASRTDHPHHRQAYTWLTEAVAACGNGNSVKLMPMVVASFLRLVTHPKIFVQPTPISEAVNFIEKLLAIAGVEIPAIGSEWPQLRQLCLDKKLSANDVPDAWLAAAIVHNGEHLVTFDADFKRLLRSRDLTLLRV